MKKLRVNGLLSPKELKKAVNTETVYLTKKESDLLYQIVKSQIDLKEGGCLNNEDGIDEGKMKLAESILTKI